MGFISNFSDSDIERFEGAEKASVLLDSSVLAILSLVKTHPSLSKDEELKLLKSGCFSDVVLHNTGFIVKTLKGYIGLNHPYFADIFNECYITLTDKAAAFNPSKSNGGRFINFVALELKGTILKSLRKFTTHHTKDSFNLANQINKMEQRYIAEFGVSPSSGVLSDYMKVRGFAKNMDEDDLRDQIADTIELGKSNVYTSSSIDGDNDEGDTSISDFIVAGESADDLLVKEQNAYQLNWVLNHCLTKRQKDILLAHFGYNLPYPVSTEDLAHNYGFTITYINQIIAAAISVLMEKDVYDQLVKNFDF